MSVRLKPDGTVEFDTVDEAVAFQRSRENNGRPSPPPKSNKATKAPKPKAKRKVQKPEPEPELSLKPAGPVVPVSDHSIRLMVALEKAEGREFVTDELSKELGIPTTRIPLLFMNLERELPSIRIPTSAVVQKRRVYVGGRLKSVYKAGRSVSNAIERAKRQRGGKLFEGE